ncbi:MAG: Rrf2 family transcriptional regulator [Bacilli bacterium]|nr:Rrf2 family transcriptional regulator [Bacilli bacterium]
MKISTRGRYALIIMINLALANTTVSLKDIAYNEHLPIKYLEKIMALLVKSNLVKSIRGKDGGYTLVKFPNDYSIGEILRASEGEIKSRACDTDNCEKQDTCPTIKFFDGLYREINEYIDNKKLSDLIKEVK